MGASIEEFKGLVSAKGGMARTNLFLVTLPSLPGATSRELNILCKDLQLPGRQIMTQERQVGMKTIKVPYGFAVDDVSMTFHVLNDWGVKTYFEVWQALAVNPLTYEVNYKNVYAKDVKIAALKKNIGLPIYNQPLPLPRLPSEIQNRLPKIGPIDLAQGEIDINFFTPEKKLYEVTLRNAFCTTMNAVQMNNDAGGLVELNVQLSYDDWTAENYGVTSSLSDTLLTTVIGGIASRLF